MNLADLLNTDQVIPAMTSTTHWGSIVEMVDHLHARGYVSEVQRPSVLEALREREEKISTGIGSGVAIPHAFSDLVEDVVVGFGRSREGIEFEALDNAPVHFIILFIVPKKQYQLHLKTLAAIARHFTNRNVRDQLAEAGSAEDILAILARRPARSS